MNAAEAAIVKSFNNITHSFNDCGRADRVDARNVYDGRSTRAPNISKKRLLHAGRWQERRLDSGGCRGHPRRDVHAPLRLVHGRGGHQDQQPVPVGGHSRDVQERGAHRADDHARGRPRLRAGACRRAEAPVADHEHGERRRVQQRGVDPRPGRHRRAWRRCTDGRAQPQASTFDTETLALLDRELEIDIETVRQDGRPKRTTIWIVVDDGEVFVRSWLGDRGHWYRHARVRPTR